MTPLQRAEKYERLAFMFCKMGTTGLIAWILQPPLFVLIVAVIAVALYGYSFTLGVVESRCFLKKPLLIMATWSVIALLDIAWIVQNGI